jgi:TonB-linked SusC/RagA family outer membrane protein
LKGAAAAALYGSRATNGVIVVTTKAGKKNARKGLEVSYSGSYSVEDVSNLPDYQNVYGQGSNQVYNGGFIGNWGAPFANHVDRINSQFGTNYSKVIVPGYPEGTVPHPLVTTGVARPRYYNVFPEFLDPTRVLDDGTLNGIPVPYQPYDIVGGFLKQGRLIENAITITSGSDKANINAGISRMTNEGIVPNSKASRTSLSFGGNSQLSNGLFITGNVNYSNTTQENPPIGGSSFGGNSGSAETSSIFTRLFYLPRNFNLNGYPFENPVTGDNVFYRLLDNPRWIAKYHKYSSNVNRVYGNITASYDVTKWLNVLLKGGINTYSENRRNIIRSGGVFDPNGNVWTDDLVFTEQDYNLIATVNKDINENINFRGLVGINANQRSFNRRFVDADNIISTGLNTTAATSSQIVRADDKTLRRLYGVFADLQVSYKNYLFLTLTGRNDWSSTLAVDARSYFYPSAGVSFVFTDVFKLPKNIIDFGKVRASVAKVGRDADPYQTSTIYRIQTPFTSTAFGINNRATLDNLLGNANLKPEFTTEYELGAELKFLQSKIGLDLTYFNRQSTQQITRARVPTTSGFFEEVRNAGRIDNKGFEIGLNLTPISTKSGFTWNTYFAFTRYVSTIVDAGEGGDIIFGDVGGGVNLTLGNIHRTGQQFGQIFGVKNARDDQGNLLINRATGTTIFLPSEQIIGNPNPDFNLGINNTFTFKGFSLQFLIDWRQGGDVYSTTAAALLLRGQLRISENREALRVIPGVYGNPQTYQPVQDANGQSIRNTTGITSFDYFFSNGFGEYGADEVNVYDATVIRLREVTLGYTFPKTWLSKTPFGTARISVSGRNLWFRTPNFLDGLNFDPEVLAETANSNVQGIEYGGTPTTRRIGVNLNLTF